MRPHPLGEANFGTRGRILRYLAATGMIDESDSDRFTANERTKALADSGYRGGVYHLSV